MDIQGWFPLGLTGLTSLLSKGLSRVFSSTSLKASILWLSAFFMVQHSQPHMITIKTIDLTIQTFVDKMIFLLFNTLSSFVIAFLPRSSSVQFSSVIQSWPTFCDPMNRRMPGLPVHHKLLEFTQTHAHRVSDAIQPSHPLSSPSPPAPNPSQHQGLFQLVNALHEAAKVLELQLQHQSSPRSKHLLISWLQSLSPVILESKKIVYHCFHFYPSICHEVMGLDSMILIF